MPVFNSLPLQFEPFVLHGFQRYLGVVGAVLVFLQGGRAATPSRMLEAAVSREESVKLRKTHVGRMGSRSFHRRAMEIRHSGYFLPLQIKRNFFLGPD